MSVVAGRSTTGRALTALVGGSALGQLVTFIASPLLTRIYSPEAFALLAVITSASSILAVVAAFRIELLIPSVSDDDNANLHVGSGICLAFFFAAIGVPTALLFGAQVEETVGVNGIAAWLWLVPLTAAIAAVFQVLNQLAIREGRFGLIASRNAVRPTAMVGSQLLLGLAGVKLAGLSIGLLIGHAVSVVLLIMRSGPGLKQVIAGCGALPRLFRERGAYLGTLVVSGLFNVAGTQLPIVLFAIYYTAFDTGQLSLTQKTLAAPVALFGSALGQVFLNSFSQRFRAGLALRDSFFRVSMVTLVIALVLTLVVAFFGEEIFSFVFGSEWRDAGSYASLMVFGISAQLVAAPVSQALIVLGRAKTQLAWDLIRFVCCCGSIVIASGMNASPNKAVVALSAATLITYVLQWALSGYYVSKWDRSRGSRLEEQTTNDEE
ncbi:MULTISPECIES: lipopolysaccharide biosynthesis protein [Dietzia]|uniref:lipopolysaccharide biosynthesis protein n=1 Tax=Dietzia TaxID=37914 RepID=UPI0015FB8156|nr:oligosaccharide flippase family protein [Dietzia psychralcaliphila]MBB1036651.1 oligosaccharide flippase family protein [Dietzia natronolimnaea]